MPEMEPFVMQHGSEWLKQLTERVDITCPECGGTGGEGRFALGGEPVFDCAACGCEWGYRIKKKEVDDG